MTSVNAGNDLLTLTSNEYILDKTYQVITKHLDFTLPYCLTESLCEYGLDMFVLNLCPWSSPTTENLMWWMGLSTSEDLEKWLSEEQNKASYQWHLSLSSSYYSLANNLFKDDINEIFITKRSLYECAECILLDFGTNEGLCLEASLLIEESSYTEVQILDDFSAEVKIYRDKISLADITSGIPQILSTGEEGEWFPPVCNGKNWILMKLVKIDRPSIADIYPSLLRESVKSWRSDKVNSLYKLIIEKHH